MYAILKAIRAKLISDINLTSIVNAKDITISYRSEKANYPCIALGIISGISESNNINRTVLSVDVYSNNNKEELWIIYERIKSILLNSSLSDPLCVFHYINEININDNQYDDAWHIRAEYEILHSLTGLNITTLASGKAYADKTYVQAIPSQEVASFRCQVSLDISFENNMRSERERFGKTVYYHTGIAKLTFSEIIFKPNILDLLWNISTDSTSYLNDGITPATIYQVSQSSYPAYLQVLFQMVKTDDGKKLEIKSDKALCQSISVPFSKKDFSIFNCQWILLGDNSGNVARVAVERS